MDSQKIKLDFPFFKEHSNAVYLDSAATSQKPQCIIDFLKTFYSTQNANAGRGAYSLSTKLLKQIEQSRGVVREFLSAELDSEIFFNSGSTLAQAQIANCLLTYLKDGDEILYSSLDHRSFVDPWFDLQRKLKHFGININLVPYQIRPTGDADINDIKNKVTEKTKLINITHVHNVFGTDADVHLLKNLRESGVFINVDAAQSVGHTKVNVLELGADFLSFSGHKMFSSFGVGVLYINKNVQEIVSKENLPQEKGTKDYPGILSLAMAINYFQDIGLSNVHAHLVDLTQYALASLRELPGLSFTKGVGFCPCNDGYGIVSFNIEGFDPLDIAFYLSQNDIWVRAGDHCTAKSDNQVNAVRCSMHIYTTREDIDGLVCALKSLLQV